ncbi:ComF family protein [Streptomyces chartreusis]
MTKLVRVTSDRWLYLCGPEEVAQQFRMLGSCQEIEVPQDSRAQYTHAFHFMEPSLEELRIMSELLKEVLTLTTKSDLDCGIAFDWYKIPPEDESPKWPNTETGELIYRGKYYNPGTAQNRARRELVDKFVKLLEDHPLYRECTQIVTVPGHKADSQSFGERLAATVAAKSGKTLVETRSPGGPRPQAKEGPSQVTEAHFAMPRQLQGNVIVLDDVYRSGTTMNAVAKTAKRAGAQRVLGLAAVRTMRN